MPTLHVDPEAVINRLSQQIGHLATEVAMKDAALEAAHARIAELEADQGEAPAP